MTPVLSALAVVLVAAISVIGTWMVTKRAKSGRIDTTEAATLWAEGNAMRGELRDKVVSLETRLAEATTQLTTAIDAITELNREIRQSRSETEASREETRKSRAETRRLMEQIDNVHDEIKTANALTIGALADNTETRRILEIPKEERTPMENEHVATANERIAKAHLPDIPKDDQTVPSDDPVTSEADREAPIHE